MLLVFIAGKDCVAPLWQYKLKIHSHLCLEMSSYLTLHVIESVCEENNSREKLKNMILYSDTTINDK